MSEPCPWSFVHLHIYSSELQCSTHWNLGLKIFAIRLQMVWTIYFKKSLIDLHLFNVFLSDMRSEMLRRYNISDQDYKLIETVIIESRPHKAGPQWKFSGAFYFSVVVVALIGKIS